MQTTMQQRQHRRPLTETNTVNRNRPEIPHKENVITPQKPAPKENHDNNNKNEPPLPRQNSRTIPPTPPKVIKDGQMSYERVGFLGEGGFARVYEVKDVRGTRVACKVVTKDSLKTKKAKTKLYAEIKIHRSLAHPNIVTFLECFEDESNVYMTLELCHSGSLMDMLRRRRRFTEPETRFFMVQLIGACHYMHSHQVIHRDLKLGNLFLDRNMNIKVGDFGLAALIENPGERKKTICGTPNYIAPEVLFDTANGHSFEVDTWSIGVILYTLSVGRPPFQTKEVKDIYKRIKDNDYEFPPDRRISESCKELIQLILTQDPSKRPTLHEIIDHGFYTLSTFPAFIPIAAYDSAPDFRHVRPREWAENYRKVRKDALLDEDAPINVPAPVPTPARERERSIAQQEKEFAKAIQPGSPISALLNSARRPLMPAESLYRKLQAVKKVSSSLEEAKEGKELAAQKARIAIQMVKEPPLQEEEEEPRRVKEKENGRPRAQLARIAEEPKENSQPKENHPASRQAESGHSGPRVQPIPHQQSGPRNSFETVANVLTAAFEAKSNGQVFREPRSVTHEGVFISSWVDYCHKYGMAYALTDGSVGVYFNDTTSMILSADKMHFDYITCRHSGSVFVRKSYTVDNFPEDIRNKVYLLKHFEGYIMGKLWGEREYQWEDVDRKKGMEWVTKYLRMKRVIVFKLSNEVLQFNFFDHTKLILSSQGLAITYIDAEYKLSRWTLAQLMTSDNCKELLEKVHYCKEVLVGIQRASL